MENNRDTYRKINIKGTDIVVILGFIIWIGTIFARKNGYSKSFPIFFSHSPNIGCGMIASGIFMRLVSFIKNDVFNFRRWTIICILVIILGILSEVYYLITRGVSIDVGDILFTILTEGFLIMFFYIKDKKDKR